MKEVFDEVIRTTLVEFGMRFRAFVPNLLAMLVLLVAGLLAAGAVRFSVGFVLRRLGFDRFSERTGVSTVIQKGGIRAAPSSFLALALAWFVLAVFVLLAVAALDVGAAVEVVNRAFAYIPNLLVAGGLLLLGSLVAGFARRSVLITAVNAGIPSARLLAGGAQAAVLVLFAAMALEHLGLGRQVILAAFTILFGGVVFALALAFGLAGRDLARESLERMRSKREERDDLKHL
jgi:Mechanosensitive ion channel, conserved TM helix